MAATHPTWPGLLNELYAALTGTQDLHRPIPAILRELEAHRLANPRQGLTRPCPWLEAWQAVLADGQLERDRREWVGRGWIPATADDRQREKDHEVAVAASRRTEAARAKVRTAAETTTDRLLRE